MSRSSITPNGAMGSGSIHPTRYRFCWDATAKANDSFTRWIGTHHDDEINLFHSSFAYLMDVTCSISRGGFRERFNG